MGGGLMQLVAYGAQDIYLTGNPQITFFKVVYRRHTNFAIESIQQTFNGTADFGKKVNVVISRNGDLIHRCYLEMDLPVLTAASGTVAWTRYIGHVAMLNVECEIGGQRIDKHYGDFYNIWNELTQTAEHQDAYDVMVGNTVDLTTQAASVAAQKIWVPLQFWWNRNPGLALPLIALQYHEVRIEVEFRSFSQCIVGTAPSATPSLSSAALWIDYIYLDTDERRRFAQVSHEYLIEQLQFTGGESLTSSSNKIKLNFNHPCKEFIWVCQPDTNTAANRWSDYTDGTTPYNGGHLLQTAKLQLNGHDRFDERTAEYFNLIQPYQHHTRNPAVGIYVYSFGLKPEEHQPTGTANMSRIDNATFNITLVSSTACTFRVYGINYNVLRIMSGMGGLAYSN